MTSPSPNHPLQELAERVIAAAGLELVQVEWKGQGAGHLLRVRVDQPGGVGLAECERASRALSAALDEAGDGLLAGPYTLEVSSPGLERPLVKRADFDRFAGQRARVQTVAPVEGSRNLTGILDGVGAEGVRLRPERPEQEAKTIAWENLAQAWLAPPWPQPGKGRRGARHR
ncbi:MAG: ribosome maturation factor RimP [Terriglobales bacterium]